MSQWIIAALILVGVGLLIGLMARSWRARGHRQSDVPAPDRAPDDLSIPWWVIATSAVVLSLGTYAGGWRIMRTLGRRIIDLDLTAQIAATQALLPHMVARGSGRLVFISSIAGKVGVPMRTAYCAAKLRLIGYADALRAVIGEDEGIHAYHHAVVRRVAEGAGVRALRIPAGARWQEIDRPEDIAHWQAS